MWRPTPQRTKTILTIRKLTTLVTKTSTQAPLAQSPKGAPNTLNHTTWSLYPQSNHHKRDFWIITSKISYSSIEPQPLPCAPVCDYRFLARAVHLYPTFTVWVFLVFPIGGAFGIQLNVCGENSQCLKTINCFRGRVTSWILGRILNATQLAEALSRIFLPVGLHEGILDSQCRLILLIHTKTTNLGLTPDLHFL